MDRDAGGKAIDMARKRKADMGGAAATQPLLDPSWDILSIDDITGRAIDDDERAYRVRVRDEAQQGLIAVDALYQERERDIHQPIIDEQGGVVEAEGSWELRRRNSITLRIPLDQLTAPSAAVTSEAVDGLAVSLVQRALGERAARVMRYLYTMANDPPYWRRPEVSVKLTDILDILGYTRDKRGVHYSANRRIASQVLLALQITQIGIQSEDGDGTIGYVGSLISGMEYRTRAKVGRLSPIEVFQQGLPEDLTIQLNTRWYRLRNSQGQPLQTYALAPRSSAYLPLRGADKGRPYGNLRQYLATTAVEAEERKVRLRRDVLMHYAGITDRRRTQSTNTLTRLLDRLVREGHLLGYSPTPLPLDDTDTITLVLPS